MTIVADLYSERGIWRSDKAYVFAANDPLCVTFGKEHGGETVSVRSAHHARSLRLDAEGRLEVPDEFIEAGHLLMIVDRYHDGKLVATWRIDPLTVVREEHRILAHPWTVSIEERLADLENALLGYSSPIFE